MSETWVSREELVEVMGDVGAVIRAERLFDVASRKDGARSCREFPPL